MESPQQRQTEHVYTDFDSSLIIGKHNEDVIFHEFAYQGVPLVRTEGKHPFDFYLPDGRSLEIKIDVRSQCTNAGAVEWPTLQRMADLYLYTFTYNRIYTHKELEQLYMSGKVPSGGFGDLGYTGRYVPQMGKHGQPGYQFIRELKMVA